MSKLIQFKDGDQIVTVEVTDGSEGVQAAGALDDAIKKIKGTLKEKFNILRTIGDNVQSTLKKVGASSAEVEFGLNFTAKGNIYVVGTEGMASLKIKLSFKGDV